MMMAFMNLHNEQQGSAGSSSDAPTNSHIVGADTGKFGGLYPFSILHAQWEDTLTGSEGSKRQ